MTPDPESTWRELMEAHRSSPASDRLTGFHLFNRAADDLARVLDDAAGRAALEMAQAQTPMFRPTCVHCRASGLEHFFTFTTTGAVLCEACYAVRAQPGDRDGEPSPGPAS